MEGRIQLLMVVVFMSALFSSGSSLSLNFCSVTKMWDGYRDMLLAGNCANCQLFFRCRANYDAVYKCGGGLLQKYAAKTISSLQEWYQNCGSVECGSLKDVAVQTANLFGRNGGNCAITYLQAVNCAYDLATKKCALSALP